jgi:hypothetical protein
VIAELGAQNACQTENLRAIKAAVTPELKESVYNPFLAFRKSVRALMADIDATYKATFWQHTDRGHCFGSAGFELSYAIEKDDRFLKIGAPKGERYAAILEDDPIQIGWWKKMVGECSPYLLDESGAGLCATPDEMLRLINDPRIGFFLLDIDNNGDRTAGMRVAMALLDGLKARLAEGPLDKPIRIVLWTSSTELEKEATRLFMEYLGCEKYHSEFDLERVIRESWKTKKIEFRVMLKSERPF